MTKEEAIALFDAKFWEQMSARERAEFQMFEEKLCMPFNIFHAAMEETLGRPVWTHEFGLNPDGLKRELRGDQAAPTMQEIIDMIPADKRLLVTL